ncbi:MAG: hypothetical protein DRI48_01670 [Chloroflexi bacterium]|nr:MAG: hypothetical protein DRI48_01670 [Chloroflexota bacterium]
MSESQTIAIQSEFDVFMARMQVRKLSRAMGFDITSQARIALATSSLARALGLGDTNHGQVIIDRLGEEECPGVRVICTMNDGGEIDLTSQTFADTRWLVDDLIVEKLPPDGLQVTVIKWMA